MQGGRTTDGEIGHGHVVVDGTDESNDGEVRVVGSLYGCDLSAGEKLGNESGPLIAETIGTGEGTISTAYGQRINTMDDEVFGGLMRCEMS